MLTEKSPTQNVSPTPSSLELNALFEKVLAEFSSNRLQTSVWEIAPESSMPPSEPIQISAQQRTESGPYPESDYQWLMEVLEALNNIVSRNVNDGFAALTETDYEQLDTVLKELIYVVGDDEEHLLAPLMDFIGILIAKYENEHFPKLIDLFPELAGDVNPNDTKDENQRDNPIKEPEKSTKALAAEAFFSIGNLFFQGDKKEAAIFAYDQAINLNPEHAHAYYNRGRAKGLLGRYKSAAVDFDKNLQLGPDDAYAYVMGGCVKIELERYEAAIEDFDKSLQLEPDVASAYLMRGYAKYQLEHYKAAIEDFDKGLQLNPDNAYAYFMRGSTRVELGRYQSAVTDCDEAIRLNPFLAEAYDIRGQAKVFLGKTQDAKADFQMALELAEQTDDQDFKTKIEQSLEELNNKE